MPIFRVKSVKIYTGQKEFTQTPAVASVTNISYAHKHTLGRHIETQTESTKCRQLISRGLGEQPRIKICKFVQTQR